MWTCTQGNKIGDKSSKWDNSHTEEVNENNKQQAQPGKINSRIYNKMVKDDESVRVIEDTITQGENLIPHGINEHIAKLSLKIYRRTKM